MKLIASLLSTAVVTTALAFAPLAAAQDSKRPTPPPASATTVKTADYIERNLGGDQVVTFTGDELPADGPSYYGTTVRRPPGIIRELLIRPRLNFVPELLKSVENL